ncbi:MAG: hypothetical protein HF308_14365 [Ignavibacteria bacterium]|jgi:predicted phage tail component-like protein|nr:hypothetical protein [Ignavibacteria bacterium]
MYGLTFNGVKKPYLVTLRGKRRPSWAPLKRNLIEIPGMPGAHLDGTDVGVRQLDIPVLIESKDFAELKTMTEDLAAWLVTSEPKELIFDDEPNRIYYAVVDGTFDPEEIVRVGAGNITFICPDPYKYGVDKISKFTNTGIVNVNGTATSEPVTTVTVSQDTTFVAISNGDDVNMIGMPMEVQQTAVSPLERKFSNDMGSLAGWVDSVSVEGGVITGTMKTTGYSFYTDTYGANAGWHGPAKKISLGSSIQDFQIDAYVKQSSTSGKVGSVEVALLDANNNFVAKMTLTKRAGSSVANWVLLRAGNVTNGYDILNTRGAKDSTWANFDGMLRISRVGDEWNVYAALVDSKGVHSARAGATWFDTKNIATNPVTQVQVQLWQYGTTAATQQYVSDVKVFKVNVGDDLQVPIVAHAGDVIEFDHQNDIIRRNGEDIRKEKAFIGEYFELTPGANFIDVEPSDSIQSTEVRWRDRWR